MSDDSKADVNTGPIKTGLNWVIGSFYLFRQNPRRWLLLALTYVAMFVALPALPNMPIFVGLLVMLFWPAFIALAIGLYREADQGRDTPVAELVALIKPHLGRLVTLGGICLVYGVLMGMITRSDSQALSEMVSLKTDPELILAQAWPLIVKVCLLLTPLVMATWFSPMLIAYQGLSVGEALKHSIWASLRNVITLGVAWLGLTLALVVVMLVAGIVVGLVGAVSQAIGSLLMNLVLLISFLFATSLLLAIQYLSYRHEYYHPDSLPDDITE